MNNKTNPYWLGKDARIKTPDLKKELEKEMLNLLRSKVKRKYVTPLRCNICNKYPSEYCINDVLDLMIEVKLNGRASAIADVLKEIENSPMDYYRGKLQGKKLRPF